MLIDQQIDLIPTVSTLHLSVVCPIILLAARDSASNTIQENASSLDHHFIILQLTSAMIPKNHMAKTVEFFPRQACNIAPNDSAYQPQPSVLQLWPDIPSMVSLEVEGTETVWNITGRVPLMLLLNGSNPDDTATCLKDMTAPRLTKKFSPVPVTSSPEGYKKFDSHVPIDVLSRFYEEQDTLAGLQVSLSLLHESVKDSALVMTHQPRYQKGATEKNEMP